MAKKPSNHREPWTNQELGRLKRLVKGNTPTPLIAHELSRAEDAVRQKSSEEGISLKPTNRGPYDRRRGTR